MKITELQTGEVIEVPNGSVLRCYQNGQSYWLTPTGEELIFDLESMIKENKPSRNFKHNLNNHT